MDPEQPISEKDLGLKPPTVEDRANAPIVQGIVEGVQSKDTSPLTPEQEKITQMIDKLKIQNEQLDGGLLTVIDSDQGQFYAFNYFPRLPMPGVLVKPGFATVVAGVDSARGSMIVSGPAADELSDRYHGRSGNADSNNIDEIVAKTKNSDGDKAPSTFTLVSSDKDLGLFGGFYEDAIRIAVEKQRELQTKRQYVPKSLDIVSRGDAMIASAKAS